MPTHAELIFRLAMGAVLGGLVGLERERLEWVAGLRTHMLVCLGSTLIMIVSSFGFEDILGRDAVVLDPSRVAAQVVSGIGFLGAGTILFLRQEVIKGLTTAASLWTVAGVGLAVGGGLYLPAVTTTVLVLVILALVKPLEQRMFQRDRIRRIRITIDRRRVSILDIDAVLDAEKLVVKEIILRRGESPSEDVIHVCLLRGLSREAQAMLIGRLQQLEGVMAVAA